jgi:hypothetical protein
MKFSFFSLPQKGWMNFSYLISLSHLAQAFSFSLTSLGHMPFTPLVGKGIFGIKTVSSGGAINIYARLKAVHQSPFFSSSMVIEFI